MARIEFYSGGKLHRLSAQFASRLSSQRPKKGTRRAPMSMTASAAPMVMRAIQDQAARLGPLFHSVNETSTFISIPKQGESAVIPTATIVLEGAKKSALKKLKSEFGVEVIDEGREGKLLLRAPEGGEEGIRQAAHAAKTAYEEMGVTTAHPNFVRVMQKMKPSAATTKTLWNLQNNGNPGIPDADVAAYAAWTITKGDASVRVAVLDEGVDTGHPALAHAVEGDFDFVDGNPTSMPDGDDAHGTACAGIIFSNDSDVPGIAPNCKLVAVRIAKGDGNNGWVFDDFKTADAIDAAWKEGEAAVLSNSWCGGPPVDIITRAFERARTRGRGGVPECSAA